MSILEGPRQIDLNPCSAGGSLGQRKKNESQTWGTCEQRKRGYHCIRWDDGVVCNFRAVFDYGEFALPSRIMRTRKKTEAVRRGTDNNAVSSNLDVVPDSRCLDHGVCTNVDMIAYFHGVIVEIPAIRFIRRSVNMSSVVKTR